MENLFPVQEMPKVKHNPKLNNRVDTSDRNCIEVYNRTNNLKHDNVNDAQNISMSHYV